MHDGYISYSGLGTKRKLLKLQYLVTRLLKTDLGCDGKLIVQDIYHDIRNKYLINIFQFNNYS